MIITFFCHLNALNYNSPALLDKGNMDVALSCFIDDDAYYGIIANTDYGLSSFLNSVVKIGYQHLGQGDIYLGLEGKLLLARRFGGTDNLALYFGGHMYHDIPGIDLSISFGNMVNTIGYFFGFDCDFNLVDKKFNDNLEYPIDFIIGVNFKPFSNDNRIIIEGGIPITSYSSYKLGASMRLNL